MLRLRSGGRVAIDLVHNDCSCGKASCSGCALGVLLTQREQKQLCSRASLSPEVLEKAQQGC